MSKTVIYLFIGIGGAIGSYVPTLFGVGLFSAWSILGTTIGSFVGLYVAVKVNQY